MQRIPEEPPKIAPMAHGVKRVQWSVMIPAYNCAGYLKQAIKSVLQQDPGTHIMQIEVVDDCSTDADIEALVWEVGNGRVSYFRQKENLGSLRNFETCINRSIGTYVHLLHGHDMVKPLFYTKMTEVFKQNPQAQAAFCSWEYINENGTVTRKAGMVTAKPGIVKNCFRKLTEGQMMQYVCTVVKREVYEKLGGFYAVTYGEDWIMWVRIAKEFPIAYTPKVLAQYREHVNSISGQSINSGKNIKDIKKVAEIISSFVPENEQSRTKRAIQRNYSFWVLSFTIQMEKNPNKKYILYTQFKEFLKEYKDVKLLIFASKLWISVLKNKLRKKKNIYGKN